MEKSEIINSFSRPAEDLVNQHQRGRKELFSYNNWICKYILQQTRAGY